MENADPNSSARPASTEAVAAPDVALPTADAAPPSPSSNVSSDVSKPVKRARKKRRQAVTEDEDIAILQAIAVVKPYSAGWGLIKKRWQQVVEHVTGEIGGEEVTSQLCRRRYENLMNRFVAKKELGRVWPQNEKLRKLLAAAVEERKQREKKAKDEDFVAERETMDVGGRGVPRSSFPVTVEGVGELDDYDEAATTDRGYELKEGRVEELQREVVTLKSRLAAVVDEKEQGAEAFAALMAAQSQSQIENATLRKDVAALQLMSRDVASLADTLQIMRARLDDQETAADARVREQNDCMQRIILESVEQQRRIEALEAAFVHEQNQRKRLEAVVKNLTRSDDQ